MGKLPGETLLLADAMAASRCSGPHICGRDVERVVVVTVALMVVLAPRRLLSSFSTSFSDSSTISSAS